MDRITLNDGRTFRVEVNWNALVHFLEASNRDDVRELSNLASLKPSDLAGLLAESINEGERLEGNDVKLTADEVGALVGFGTMAEFITIFTKQTSPKGPADEAKKE
jgi:hypothetical protein